MCARASIRLACFAGTCQILVIYQENSYNCPYLAMANSFLKFRIRIVIQITTNIQSNRLLRDTHSAIQKFRRQLSALHRRQTRKRRHNPYSDSYKIKNQSQHDYIEQKKQTYIRSSLRCTQGYLYNRLRVTNTTVLLKLYLRKDDNSTYLLLLLLSLSLSLSVLTAIFQVNLG